MNKLYDVGIIIPFYEYGDEESRQKYDFSHSFCGIGLQTQVWVQWHSHFNASPLGTWHF